MNEAPSTASRAAPAKLHPLLVAAALSLIGASVLAAVALINGHVSARHLAGAEQAVVASVPALQTPPAVDAPPSPTVVATAPASKPAAPKRVPKPAPAPAAAATPATTTVPAAPMPAPPPAPICRDCGTVTAIREVQTPGSANGVGAIAGGVVGGVIGNQVGKGSGRDAARILGAIGGAVAGHQIEKRARTTTRYDIDVRMDDGQLRTISRSTPPELRIGDAVRLQGDTLLHDGHPVAERPQPAPLDRGGA